VLNVIKKMLMASVFSLFATSAAHARPDDSRISQLLSQGQFATAQQVLEQGEPTELDKMFFLARVFKATGRTEDAIALFVEILNQDPNYLNARRELAHTLLAASKYEAAKTQLDILLRVDQNPQMQAGYRQMQGIIDQNRPIGISGVFALIPSTNINKGTTNSCVETTSHGCIAIDPESRPNSGVGLQLGVSGYFRKVIDAQSRISLQWSATQNFYQDPRNSSISAEVSIPYEHRTANGGYSIAPFYRANWGSLKTIDAVGLYGTPGYTPAVYAENVFTLQSSGLRFSADRRLSAQNRLALALTYEERDYPHASYQNGAFSSETLSFSRQIDPSLSYTLGAGFEQSTVFDPTKTHLAYNGGKLFASINKAWDGGLRTGLGLEVGYRHFVGDYPLTTAPRADEFYGINVSLAHARVQVWGFVPSLRCAYTFNTSTIAFFDFEVVDCTLGLSKEF
jgi:tetratricopeptide (TPR) repeat protein